MNMAKGSEGKDPEYLSTLERGLTVLSVFSSQQPQMTLSDVAIASGLSPAVARRCLNTLVSLGYIARQGRRFILRPKVLELSDRFLTSMNIEQAIMPFLQNLRDDTGDSASMAVRADDDVMYIAHVSTNRPIRLSAHAGTRFPLHATSLGKVLIAHMEGAVLEDYLAHSDRDSFTSATITSASKLRKEAAIIRKRGFATACDELDYGITSIAVPIFDPDGRAIAAINCSTATSRVAGQDIAAERLPRLLETKSQIERSLRRFPMLCHALS